MKIQDCELLSPEGVNEIHKCLDAIMDIADRLQAQNIEGASSIWMGAYRISWIVSPKQ